MKYQNILVVLFLCISGEIIRPRNHDFTINQNNLMMHLVSVGIEAEIQSSQNQIPELATRVIDLIALHHSPHADSVGAPRDQSFGQWIRCESESEKLDALLRRVDE